MCTSASVNENQLPPLHRLDLPPAALVPGDADDRGRWVVQSAPDDTVFPADDAPARHQAQALHRAPATAAAETSGPDGTPEVISGDANGVLRAWPTGGRPRRSAFDRRPSPVTALATADFPTARPCSPRGRRAWSAPEQQRAGA